MELPTRHQRRRVLILAKTYPNYSYKYVEVVCSGGIFEDTGELCRIYPIPYRYLEDVQQMKLYQWVELDVWQDAFDPRPESWKADFTSIQLGDVIPTDSRGWAARARVVKPETRAFPSVNALKAAQKESGASIGAVKPTAITDVWVEELSPADEEEWLAKEKAILSQPDWTREVKPLDWLPVRFGLSFQCADGGNHRMRIHDWGLYEQFRREWKVRRRDMHAAAEGVRRHLADLCDLETRDVYLFLGSMRERLWEFTIMGAWYPKMPAQRSLL